MAKVVFFVLILLPSLAHAVDIRVRLKKHVHGLSLRAAGLVDVTDQRRLVLENATLTADGSCFRVRSGNEQWVLPWRRLDVEGETLWNGNVRLASRLEILPLSDGSVDVVAVLPLENYLAGVVPGEMPMRWPSEALKAQAVAARSYAYHRMIDRRDEEFDVDADVGDQHFQFEDRRAIRMGERIVTQTEGLVLLGQDQDVFEALYHADCGGQTEDANNVWGGDKASLSHPDCPHVSRHWSYNIQRETLRELLTEKWGLSKTAELRSVHVDGRSPTGRVLQVQFDFGRDGARTLSSQEFRKVVGYDKVRSTNFHLTWFGEQLHVAGLGEGHGVGLCQLGARALALQGKDYREILAFYYPNTRLAPILSQ